MVPADGRAGDQHRLRLLGANHVLKGCQVRRRRIGGQLRIVDQHNTVGCGQQVGVRGAVLGEHEDHDLSAARGRRPSGGRQQLQRDIGQCVVMDFG